MAHDSPASDHTTDAELGEPVTPEAEDEEPAQEESAVPEGAEQSVLVAEWGECAGGDIAVDFESWQFTGETDWSILAHASGDVDGYGSPEAVLALGCGDRTAVAAFLPHDDGLDNFAWVWQQPDESQRFSELAGVEDGVITLQGLGAASETWTARYEWDGAAFVLIDDAPTTDPSSSETTATPDSGETQTTPSSPTTDGQVS